MRKNVMHVCKICITEGEMKTKTAYCPSQYENEGESHFWGKVVLCFHHFFILTSILAMANGVLQYQEENPANLL